MSNRRRGLYGRLFNQQLYMRDSHHAANNFGLNKSALNNGTPRLKFQFFVNIKFNTDPLVKRYVENFLNIEDQAFVTALVKNVTLPSSNINTEVLNQYNKRRVIQTKINFNPITLTFHDTVEGKTLRLWEMYYEYYFKEGVAPDKLELQSVGRGVDVNRKGRQFEDDSIKNNFVDNAGYNLERVGNNKQLIKGIEIFQVNGGKFTKIDIVNPIMTAFNHDTLDYSISETVEFNMNFEYENVLYANINEQLTEEELDRYRSGDFWEMANLITIRTNVRGRNLNANAPKPNLTACDIITENDLTRLGSESNPIQAGGRTRGRLDTIVGRRNIARVQDSITGVVDSIPDAIATAASASVFGGKVSFQPNPIKAVKSSVNQLSRAAATGARREFTSAVASGIRNVITGVQQGRGDGDEQEGEDDGS